MRLYTILFDLKYLYFRRITNIMKMKKVILILYFFIFYSFFSYCQGNAAYEKMLTHRIEKLKLDNIKEGFDSIQIRIWPYFSCHCKSIGVPELIIFKNDRKQWTGQFYTFGLRRFNDSDIDSFNIKSYVPKNSWIDLLNKIKISDLLNFDKVKDSSSYNLISTNPRVDIIEISTKNRYQLYIYSDLRDIAKESVKTKIICNLIDTIIKE